MRAYQKTGVTPDWVQLLADAVNTPGIISSAYTRFWNYSVGNQLLAIFECLGRGLPLGPVHTFRGWLELGRHVKKGEKAITLCMPVSVKRKTKQRSSKSNEQIQDVAADERERITIFIYKPRWFVLSQTDGVPYVPTEIPNWSESKALKTLGIDRIDFNHLNGNCQGFATQRQVAVSPIAVSPHETLFHEVAHVVLGHTQEGACDDHQQTPKSLREVEAECVALICCESLGLDGAAECRGYIQHWLGQKHEANKAIPSNSVQKIFRAADSILKAGYPADSLDLQLDG